LLRSKEQRQLEAPIFVIREELRHLPREDRGLNEAHKSLYANDVEFGNGRRRIAACIRITKGLYPERIKKKSQYWQELKALWITIRWTNRGK